MASKVWSYSVVAGLTQAERETVERRLTRRRYSARAMVFSQGDAGDMIYLIDSGRIRTFVTTWDGTEITTGFWSTGQVLGLSTALSKSRCLYSAQATTSSVLLSLPLGELRPLIMQVPALAWNLMTALALIADWALERTTRLATDPVAVRLAWALVAATHMQRGLDRDGSGVIENLSQEEIARIVNASRPWIAAKLAEFEESGLIQRKRRRIVIPRVALLEALAAHALVLDQPMLKAVRSDLS